MKAYTDIEQSKMLAGILSIESADGHYVRKVSDFMGNPVDGEWSYPKYGNANSKYAHYVVQNFESYEVIPCWSLAALLEIIRGKVGYDLSVWDEGYSVGIYDLESGNVMTELYSNPVDAIVGTIYKLKEKDLL